MVVVVVVVVVYACCLTVSGLCTPLSTHGHNCSFPSILSTERVHRDLRWPNIITVTERGATSIKVIDYEKTGELGAECTGDHYPLPYWVYGDGRTVLEDNNIYSARSDFKMIGKVLMARLASLGPVGKDLMHRLEDGQYESASDVLAHEWFQ